MSSSSPSHSTHAIHVNQMTVSYDEQPVVRSVSFQVAAGQLVGIIGPNGAGKSTLLKSMLGLIALRHGTIQFFGQSLNDYRKKIAYVPQRSGVDWDFPVTVLDVALMGRMGCRGWLARPKKLDRQLAKEALERVGMIDLADRHIRHLSGGQQQRVFLARALAQSAEILLLDEPLAGVDAATEETFFQLIDQLIAEQRTVLVVNHDLSLLNRFDQLLLLNQTIIAYGPPSHVATDANLRRTYSGRLNLLEQADRTLQQMKETAPK